MVVKRALFASPRYTKKAKYATTATVQRMIKANTETKYYSGNFTFDPPTTLGTNTGVNLNVSAIAAGTSQFNRVGNRIRLLSFELRILGRQCGHVRVILYSPKDPSQILNPPTQVSPGVYNPGTNAINNDEHWVHHDHIYMCNESAGGGVTINLVKKLRHHIEWKGPAADAYSRNPVYCLVLPEFGGLSGLCDLYGYHKIYYKDA